MSSSDIADHITSCIVVQQTVEADALDGSHETARRCEGLQTATGADAYHRQRAVLILFLTGVIIDIRQCVEFVDYDVDVVTADTMTLTGDALTLIGTRDGVELAAANLALFRVEMGCNGIYSGRIAHKNHLVGQLFGLQMKVEA